MKPNGQNYGLTPFSPFLTPFSEEIQHGLDKATSEASKSIYRGLSNDQFHAEVFQRIIDNNKAGKFQFLTGQDIDMLGQLVQGLK